MSRPAFPELCRRVCEAQRWELLPTGVLVRFGDGRSQLVRLDRFESGRNELVRLTTTIGDAEKLSRARLARALELNASLAHGALAITGGELCLTDTLLLDTADAEELEAAIDYLARHADDYERALFGTDEH